MNEFGGNVLQGKYLRSAGLFLVYNKGYSTDVYAGN